MQVLYLIRLFVLGMGFPLHINKPYIQLYICEYLHFRYLIFLMIAGGCRLPTTSTTLTRTRTIHFSFILLMEEILHQLIGSFSHYLKGFIVEK